jgi:glycosyltransferase involved in cell wall biosynthesis
VIATRTTGRWSRLRILVAHSSYRLAGGEDRYVTQQVDLLRRYHDVEVLMQSNVDLTHSVGTAARMIYSANQAAKAEILFRSFRPDVVHLHNPYPSLGPAVHIAAKRQGVPLVMTVHNLRLRCPNGLMYTQGQPCRRCESGNYANAVVHRCFPSSSQAAAYGSALWIHRFLLRLERMVDLFLAPSDFIRRRLLRWGIQDRRVRMIRNFVADIARAPTQPGAFGLYVGRLSEEKGLQSLLAALASAGDPPFRIVGDGPLESELAALADRVGLTRTRFVGRLDVDQVREHLREARFLVMPSECDENAPLALLEAMGCGLPVVVTRRGGLPELVARGGGIVCEPGDVADLAGTLTTLMRDEGLCRALGLQALTIAMEEFTARRHRLSLEDAYRSLVSVGSRGITQGEEL